MFEYIIFMFGIFYVTLLYDTNSNSYEYQEYFLGVKAASA